MVPFIWNLTGASAILIQQSVISVSSVISSSQNVESRVLYDYSETSRIYNRWRWQWFQLVFHWSCQFCDYLLEWSTDRSAMIIKISQCDILIFVIFADFFEQLRQMNLTITINLHLVRSQLTVATFPWSNQVLWYTWQRIQDGAFPFENPNPTLSMGSACQHKWYVAGT